MDDDLFENFGDTQVNPEKVIAKKQNKKRKPEKDLIETEDVANSSNKKSKNK